MEQQASNIDYYKADNKGLCPDNWCVKVGAPATLSSRIDMGKLCSAVNNSTCDINAFLSQDCGNYLCGYIYYSSLLIDPTRTAFIHVPMLNEPFSAAQMAAGMETVCSAVNKSNCDVDAVVSLDPGRYLCDYIYYTSLHINPFCTAFIHVPPLNQPYTARQLAVAIRIAILAMLRMVPD
ncbi:hypothetical protein NP493_482g00019 [Ridgeia piscesae]|uniref:Uncharacterized protein n=1 Tax=Ridgeia piscesae TaxID=27915 RepID=A0AAD9KZC9_RIDPI|nr:hypothetical protein NP493_482g00019 [Ridgeia piscesae]